MIKLGNFIIIFIINIKTDFKYTDYILFGVGGRESSVEILDTITLEKDYIRF